MKKLTSILTAIALILAITPAAFAAVYTEGYFKYTIADESITITGYFGDEETVTVPAMIAGIPVNTIASGAFSGSGIKVLNLPDTITAIESGAIDAGVVINYNSNLPSGGQEQTQPNPPRQDSPQPPQPNLPGIVIIPPATQSSVADDTSPDDIIVSEEPIPDDITVTETDTEDKAETEQPRQGESQSTKPTQSDDSKPEQSESSQPEPSEDPAAATTQNAIEEVEIELDLEKTQEVTTSAAEEATASTEQTEVTEEGEAAAEAAAEPEPTEDGSPNPFVYAAVAAAAVAAMALGGLAVWKKKK